MRFLHSSYYIRKAKFIARRLLNVIEAFLVVKIQMK